MIGRESGSLIINQVINMEQLAENAFISHILRYVGVGLISGSVVHAGTLGGGSLQYTVLILLGVIAFVVGTLLEERNKSEGSLLKYVLISVILSLGVGMVSGGTQHYLDGPVYASFLIPIGLGVGYLAFLFRDYTSKVNLKRIVGIAMFIVVSFGALYSIAHSIPTLEDHHASEIGY